jgi:hypothetical protein
MTDPLITGSWIDIVHPCARDGVYWNRQTLAYRAEDWHRLVRHLRHDLGIELLIIQNVAKDGLSVYPSKHLKVQWRTRHCDDPLGAIVRACSLEGVELYMGVGIVPGDSNSGTPGGGDQALAWYLRISEELLERYGDEVSFVGWYVSAEMYFLEGALVPEQVAFNRRLTDMWRGLTPDMPTLASPYFLGGKAFVHRTDALVRAIADTGLTTIAYQDGIGCATGRHPSPIHAENNGPLFEALRWAHDHTGVALWANTELFRFENEIFFQPLLPAPFERIRSQLRHAAPWVDRIIAYTVPGLMTSQTHFPDLGHLETERLYQAYRGYRDAVAPRA